MSRSVWLVSSQTSCWRCLAEWIDLHDPRPAAPPRDTIVRAARHLKDAIHRPPPRGLAEIDLRSGHVTVHPVSIRPQCPRCGDPTRRFHPIAGTPKKDSTAERIGRLMAEVDPITGWVSQVTTSHLGRVFLSQAAFVSPKAPGIAMSLRQEPSVSCGAGTSRAQSLARCLGEAVERYSLTFQGHEAVVWASWNQLGEELRPPAEILRPFSANQYRQREAWNRGEWGYPVILQPLGQDDMTDWSPARSLLHRRDVLLPTQILYFGSGRRPPLYFVSDTSGCAAGESLEQAVLGALLELIERDAIAIWWYNRLLRPPANSELLETRLARPWSAYLRKLKRPFWLLDITTSLGVPVFAAVSTSSRDSHVALGFGCHPDAAEAAAKALRELSQTSQGIEEVRPETMPPNTMQRAFCKWSSSASPAYEAHLAPHTSALRLPYATLRTDLLSHCMQCLTAFGHDPLGLVLTRQEIGWPVVRVVCPKLCHPWHRLGIQRLYQEPVTSGLLPGPLSESLLNPVPYTL
jgi:thiazole/oxazole-forming peptide maturase SagD family component